MRICYIYIYVYILQLLILFQTMYSSDTISRNNMSSSNISGANSMLFSTSNYYKHGFDGDILKSKDMTMMASSDTFQHHQQQQQQNNGGLTRYRSAPSTFFASFLDGTSANNGATSDSSHGEDEAETMFSAFMEVRDLKEANHQQQQQMQFSSNLKQERMEYEQQQDGFSTDNSQLVYETSINGGSGNGSYGALMENQMQGRINGNGNCSNNLVRQSSSPAGFFTGFDLMREIGSFRASNGTHGESNSVTNGLNNHMNFTSRPSSTSRFMPSIAENVDGNTGTGNTENEHLGSVNDANDRSYASGFAHGSWNDSTPNSLKRNRDGDIKMFSTFNGLENQNGDSRNFTSGLTHHLSLPKTSGEMAAIEKYLQFQQDVVPCKVRARRGCATHPRSIAERMRRTRISERMKKLQELFPNMDKQTNTADMLDLAVDYIKDLQKQVQTLTDVKAKCTCSSK